MNDKEKQKTIKKSKVIDMNTNISFIMPAYNCAATVEESVKSIMDGNFQDGDELVIVNDCSTDNTESVLNDLKAKYPEIKIIKHTRNKGGAATRNTAIKNTQNQILFCLDSDNVLVPGSIQKLKAFMQNSGADVASFQELHYFKDDKDNITHKWIFKQGLITLADCLAGPVTPGASGNCMFTKESWIRAGRYPEFAGALDAWGFGFRQLATGSKMIVMPQSFYHHRYGHESYWARESKNGQTSLTAIQIIIPFIDLINDKDVDYIMSRKGRDVWFTNLEKRPIRLKSGESGSTGFTTIKKPSKFQIMRAKVIGALSRTLPSSIKYFIRGKT
jgi:glycosyltransferase involved in cell wall biosynthesis